MMWFLMLLSSFTVIAVPQATTAPLKGTFVAVRCKCESVAESQIRGRVLRRLRSLGDVTVTDDAKNATEILTMAVVPVPTTRQIRGYAIAVAHTHVSHYSFADIEEYDGGGAYYMSTDDASMNAVVESIVADLDAGELTHWRSH